jgi:ABC-2 type transport system ATP-binding protein
VALDNTARLLAAFSERVLRVKFTGCELPVTLAAGASRGSDGDWRLPVEGAGQVESALARLRESGARIEHLEVTEPELEEVFVKIMASAGVAARAPA